MKDFILQSLGIVLLTAALTTVVAVLHPGAPAWYRVVEEPTDGDPYEVTVEEIQGGKWDRQPIFYLDARATRDFEEGHLDGALLMNESEFEDQLWENSEAFTDLDRLIVVYCDGLACERSAKIAELLRERLQLRNVWVLRGDWTQLEADLVPEERS